MGRFFNMDNKFFVFMGKIADLCMLNLLCIICCIPIVTAGASLTALYYVTMKMVRNEEAYIFRSFFRSFKQNFKQATVINIIMLAGKMGQPAGKILGMIFAAFTLLYVMILLYVYPLLAKFYNSVKNTFKNAILMAIRHLPYTILMLLICACPILILFIPSFQIQMSLIMLVILFGPAVIAYGNSHFFVRIFDKYIPEESVSEETEVMS